MLQKRSLIMCQLSGKIDWQLFDSKTPSRNTSFTTTTADDNANPGKNVKTTTADDNTNPGNND